MKGCADMWSSSLKHFNPDVILSQAIKEEKDRKADKQKDKKCK